MQIYNLFLWYIHANHKRLPKVKLYNFFLMQVLRCTMLLCHILSMPLSSLFKGNLVHKASINVASWERVGLIYCTQYYLALQEIDSVTQTRDLKVTQQQLYRCAFVPLLCPKFLPMFFLCINLFK